jgi:predicted RNA-binding protein with PUA-like domain
MAEPKRYWLMKSEPSVYSIGDLQRDGSTSWEGVRNYQARNFMRDDMRLGDGVLFYHSNAKPMGIYGVAEVVREAYPDDTAFDPNSRYYDAKSDSAQPTWLMVDVGYVRTFKTPITLAALKDISGLEAMMVIRKGSRLSVQPVTQQEWDVVMRIAAQ